MKVWNDRRRTTIRALMVGAAQLVFVAQRAPAAITNGVEHDIRLILSDLRDTDQHRPVENDLIGFAQKSGISSQELAMVLLKVMNDSLGSAVEESEGVRAVYALGSLRIEAAFDDLRNVARHAERRSTIRAVALTSALRVAGRQLIPFAKEIRDGGVFPGYDRGALYVELRRRLGESAKLSGEQRDRAIEEQRAEIAAFLLDCAGKETDPSGMKVIDEALCYGVPQYDVSTERERFLQKTRTQCERVERERGRSQAYVREYVDRQLEALRLLPKEKRTSIGNVMGLEQ